MNDAILTKLFEVIEQQKELEHKIDDVRDDLRETQNAFNNLVRQLSTPAANTTTSES